ncbi:hypothetical protein FHG66_11010 [Rubellimicrobium rubrum]|uniref:Glycosyl transferase family 28 C-terminal domain-containing protein n=1 Tax=Rubellimicrobium rubrum TaxID=2585369 RepID=A0A5C4MYG1_9RHOB|nr:hypothetical protein [Rubellimicrobium rubrum]TNC49628.1 hypothetical protein FHG66_11010 [Rubellimicrobium rubrum]
MLYCENARGPEGSFDDLAVFVSQLEAAGIEVGIGPHSVPSELSRNAIFDAVARVRLDQPGSGDALLLVKGHELTDRSLTRLRRLGAPANLRTLVLGRFPSFQSVIGAKMKLSYALGENPEVLDVPAGLGVGSHHLPVFGVKSGRGRRQDSRPVLLLISPDLKSDTQREALFALAASPLVRLIVLTEGETKQDLQKVFGQAVTLFHYGEILPVTLAPMADVALVFSAPSSSYRSQALLANLVVSGVAVADCSREKGHVKYANTLLQGPADLLATGTYLFGGILSAAGMIGREIAGSKFAASLDGGETLLAVRRLQAPAEALAAPVATGGTPRRSGRSKVLASEFQGGAEPVTSAPARETHPLVFVPTNGVGLGHAQRTSLIASEIDPKVLTPAFAAFPSCMKMLKSYGFDVMPLVSRSGLHRAEHENDLVNYLRLRGLTRGSKTLVFDGGYVFDSIYRSILENNLNGIWVRRGLWQKGQDNSIALDREKAFSRVIVPSEAFEELNEGYSQGSHIRTVGPIVQRQKMTTKRREKLRGELASRYGREFRHLAVTMLGGGVAADRSAQTAAICAMMASRRDTLHLLVVWPTATVEAGAYAWPNTRVVKTHHASALVAAADLYISAVGYNSFHEVIYNRVPTIFMAQMAQFMDDQQARAMAAVNRGCADIVAPDEMLSLRHKISAFLDGGRSAEIRAALSELTLPEPGNAEAAHLILELTQ